MITNKAVESIFNPFYQFSLLLFFLTRFNPDINNITIIQYFSFALIGLSYVYLLISQKVYINKYIMWLIAFNVICIASSLWAIDSSLVMKTCRGILLNSVVLSFISLIIKTEDDLYKILKIFILSSFLTAVYILLVIDMSRLGEFRIASNNSVSEAEGWHSNIVGAIMAFSTFVVLFLMKNISNEKKRKMYNLFCLFIFSFITVFSGSKNALFLLLLCPSLYVFFSQKNKFSASIGIIIVFITLFYLVMNVPILYNAVGRRIDAMLEFFSGNTIADGSTRVRMRMIALGIEWIKNKPLLGYGINNYSILYGNATGIYLYSHNNFIEIFTSIGIIGGVIYYYIYIYIIKNTLKYKKQFSYFALSIMLSLLFAEVNRITYYVFYVQLLVCFSFLSLEITQSKNTY